MAKKRKRGYSSPKVRQDVVNRSARTLLSGRQVQTVAKVESQIELRILRCEIHRHPFNGMVINFSMRGVYESRNQEATIMDKGI